MAPWVDCAGTYGEFKPNQPVDVPIWLAIELRKRNQCDIKMPPWMEVQQLRETVNQERTDLGHFQPLPFHYIEVCPDCTPKVTPAFARGARGDRKLSTGLRQPHTHVCV